MTSTVSPKNLDDLLLLAIWCLHPMVYANEFLPGFYIVLVAVDLDGVLSAAIMHFDGGAY